MNYFQELIDKHGGDDGKITVGTLMAAIFSIHDAAHAHAFYEGYLEWQRAHHADAGPPEDVCKSNIGWCFGEGMSAEDREMWSAVCDAAHPVFGTRVPTAQEAFAAGVTDGLKARKRMFDFGIEAITEYPEIAYYGRIWHVEFVDYTSAVVIEDLSPESPDWQKNENYVFAPVRRDGTNPAQ